MRTGADDVSPLLLRSMRTPSTIANVPSRTAEVFTSMRSGHGLETFRPGAVAGDATHFMINFGSTRPAYTLRIDLEAASAGERVDTSFIRRPNSMTVCVGLRSTG